MNCNFGLPDCPRIDGKLQNESISTTSVYAYMNYMKPITRIVESFEHDNYLRMRELATNQRPNFQPYPSDRIVRFELIYFLIVKIAATMDKIPVPRKPIVFIFKKLKFFFFFI